MGQKSKKQIVFLKIDIENTFDKLEHQAILQVLRSKGFLEKWIEWIHNILESGSSLVLLNVIAGKEFNCLRGVWQGDPFYLF